VQGYLDLLARYREPRVCRFEDAIGYLDAKLDGPRIFLREETGSIAPAARGSSAGHKSAIATLFVPARQPKTIAEMTEAEFAAYRSRPAMEEHYRALAEFLRSREAIS
jgi:inosine/xanthosine triphosphate pyrophosphatase family protein